MFKLESSLQDAAALKGVVTTLVRRPSKRRAPFQGEVVVGAQSGIRKLDRAMRRGMLSGEHQRIIRDALDSAHSRRTFYMSKSARGRLASRVVDGVVGGWMTMNEARSQLGLPPLGEALA